MGGALAIASGVLVPEVDAVVAFYGTPSSELADPSKAQAPIQAHFGEVDSFVGFADVTVRTSLPFCSCSLLLSIKEKYITLLCHVSGSQVIGGEAQVFWSVT
jgi:hypothetical protein